MHAASDCIAFWRKWEPEWESYVAVHSALHEQALGGLSSSLLICLLPAWRSAAKLLGLQCHSVASASSLTTQFSSEGCFRAGLTHGMPQIPAGLPPSMVPYPWEYPAGQLRGQLRRDTAVIPLEARGAGGDAQWAASAGPGAAADAAAAAQGDVVRPLNPSPVSHRGQRVAARHSAAG